MTDHASPEIESPLEMRKLLAMGLISLVPLTIVGYLGGQEWTYVAASLLLLNARNKGLLSLFCLAGLLIGWWWCIQSAQWLPNTIDLGLWMLDNRLGYEPRDMIELLVANPWLTSTCKAIYFGFPLALTLAALGTSKAEWFFEKVAVATVLGTLSCMAFPACGPAYVITNSLRTAPRNAMPSMHTAWALLVFWSTRGRKLPYRLLGDMFLIFTIVATLGSGEHYLVDLIAAIPLFALVEFCTSSSATTNHVLEPSVGK